MSNGFRKASSTKKDKFKELDVAVKNCEMATRLTQMMMKQLLTQVQTSRADLDNVMGMLNDFQYRTLAMLELSGVEKSAIDAKADEFKLKDYNDASDKEDVIKGYSDDAAGAVDENSVVIITSTVEGNDRKGIFRSKFPVSECLIPSLKEKLIGRKVGDSFEETIQNDVHTVTLLGLKKKSVAAAQEGEVSGEKNEGN